MCSWTTIRRIRLSTSSRQATQENGLWILLCMSKCTHLDVLTYRACLHRPPGIATELPQRATHVYIFTNRAHEWVLNVPFRALHGMNVIPCDLVDVTNIIPLSSQSTRTTSEYVSTTHHH
jgi:hypothetical protein